MFLCPVNVYLWCRLSSRMLCCLVITTLWYEAGEVGLYPFGRGENWMQDLEHIHTRWKTDLFWKDFQKTLSDNLAQICDLFLCCWNYNFSKDNLCKRNRKERWLSPAGEGLSERESDILLEKIDRGRLTQHDPELLFISWGG